MKNQLFIYTLKSNMESRIKGSYYQTTEITFKYSTKKALKEAKHSNNIHGYSVTSILTWTQAKKMYRAEYLRKLLEENKYKLKQELAEIGEENICYK